MPPNAAFSRTKCAGPTIAPMGTICILFVCLTTRMNPSTESAQPWRSLYFVGITTTYSWALGRNTHCWVILHLLEMVDIAFPAGRRSWNWRICSVESSWSIIQENKEFDLGRCYRGHSLHFAYTGPRCYELQAWSLGWHWYILPCNQVPDAQQKSGCEMVDCNTTAHSGV